MGGSISRSIADMVGLLRFVWFLWLIFLLSALAFPRAAKADYPIAIATIQCDAPDNQALIRFFTVDSGGTLPAAGNVIALSQLSDVTIAEVPDMVDKRWANFPYQMDGSCKLKNGKILTVSTIDGQIGMGMDEGLPDSYFKLQIGDVVAYDERQFLTNFGAETPFFNISAVEYDGHSLQECSPPDQDDSGKVVPGSAPSCRDVSARLLPGGRLFDEQEKSARKAELFQAQLQAKITPFCVGIEKAVAPTGYPGPAAIIGFGNGPNGVSNEQDVDIRNLGQPDQVFQVSGGNDFFSGAFLVVFEHNQPGAAAFTAKMQRDWPNKSFFDDPESYAAKHWGGYFISIAPQGVVSANVSFRYLQNDLVKFEGKIYILSADADPHSVPSGVVSQLSADNRIETICQFP